MGLLKRILRESKTRFYQSFYAKHVHTQLDTPLISFSFDDVPHSALDNGIPILDKYNIKATFYISVGLYNDHPDRINSDQEKSIYLSQQDIQLLHRSGHDIACHTYSHYRLSDGSPIGLERDAKKNIQALEKIIGTSSINHFSYPFGEVTIKAKKLLSKHYKSMRSSRPGFNQLSADMNLLRATPIYSESLNKSEIIQLIQSTKLYGGWLIFYTHGVGSNPDDYSCTPDDFDWVVRKSIDSGAAVLPVSTAYDKIILSQHNQYTSDEK